MAIAGCSNIGSFNFGNRFDSLPEVFARKGDYAPRSLRIAQHSAIVLAGAGGVYVGFGLSDDKLHSSILETLSALFFGVLAVVGVSFYPVVLGIGFLLHAVWDCLHHWKAIDTKVRFWYPPFCAIYDCFVGIFLLIVYVN